MAKSKREDYTEIYSQYYPYVFNTVFSKIGNEHDANDICQEIFIIFFEKYEQVDNPRKWLFGVMRNVLFRYYEKKSKVDVDIDTVFDDVSLTYVNGFRDTRIIIEEAIENIDLSEQERLILEYIAFNNYSYTNVGKIMGLSKRQVGYKYLGIVTKVTDYLKKKGITDIEELL